MESKDQGVFFVKDDKWLNDFTFLIDITHYLSEMNLKLQGINQLVNSMVEHLSQFQAKLQLFEFR